MALAAAFSTSPTASIKALLSRLTDIKLVVNSETNDVSQLPVELLVVIGQFLAGEERFATLAALNVTCRAVYEETLKVLYETLTLRFSAKLQSSIWFGLDPAARLPPASKYVKYLIIEGLPNFLPRSEPDSSQMPAIRAVILKCVRPETFYYPFAEFRDVKGITWLPCTVYIHEPIRSDTLATLMASRRSVRRLVTQSPGEVGAIVDAIENPRNYVPERITQLTVNKTGQIVETTGLGSPTTTLTWLLAPCNMMMDIVAFEGGPVEALRLIAKVLDAGLGNDLVNLCDTFFHVTVRCDLDILPGLLAIRGTSMAPRRILSAFTMSSDGIGTGLDLPQIIIELVSRGADGYLDARVNKFRTLKATRQSRQYQGIVNMNRWHEEPPLAWNPDVAIFAATVCTLPPTGVSGSQGTNSRAFGDGAVLHSILAYAADQQTRAGEKQFGLYVTVQREVEAEQSRMVFQKLFTKPAVL